MIIVCDTSALIHDPTIIMGQYPDDDLVIPMVVIQELDKLKTQEKNKGYAARRVLSALDQLREENSTMLSQGVDRPCGGTLRIELNHVAGDGSTKYPDGFEHSLESNDLKIIAVARNLTKHTGIPHVLLTQDRAMSVIADALDIHTRRHELVQEGLSPGVVDVESPEFGMISDLYEDHFLYHESFKGYPVNSGVVLTEGNASALGLSTGTGTINLVEEKDYSRLYHLEPQGARQKLAAALLTGGHQGVIPEEFLGALSGRSGSGKTTLAISAGLEGVSRGVYDRIMVFRPTEPVGKDIGFLPGSAEEKMLPWSAAIDDILRDLGVGEFMDVYDADTGEQKMGDPRDILSVEPINFVRGRSLRNTFVIVDEAQNCDITELRTLASRCGKGSAFVCTFDPSQIDNAYLRSDRAEGVEAFLEKVMPNKMSWHIQLDCPLRGGVSALVD